MKARDVRIQAQNWIKLRTNCALGHLTNFSESSSPELAGFGATTRNNCLNTGIFIAAHRTHSDPFFGKTDFDLGSPFPEN